jgi:hypothetical protein
MNNEIRNLDFLSWIQPSAWMESMSGTKWNNLLKKENELFENILEKVSTIEEIQNKMEDFHKQIIYFQYDKLLIKYLSSNLFEYNDILVKDIIINNKYIYQIRDIGKGAEKYRLE